MLIHSSSFTKLHGIIAVEGYVPCLGVALAGVGAVPALGVVEEEVQGVGAGPRPVAHAHLHEHPDNRKHRVRLSLL